MDASGDISLTFDTPYLKVFKTSNTNRMGLQPVDSGSALCSFWTTDHKLCPQESLCVDTCVQRSQLGQSSNPAASTLSFFKNRNEQVSLPLVLPLHVCHPPLLRQCHHQSVAGL